MPLSSTESEELRGYLRNMSRKKDIVGLKGTPGEKFGGFMYWCVYGWRVTGEPIFKHQDSWEWKDSQGLDVKEEDVNMFIVFGSIWKGSEKIFMDRYYGWKFITDRVIAFENLNDAARDLGLKVMIDPVSLWLYIDDSVPNTSLVVHPGGQGQLATTLQYIRDALEELKKKYSGAGPSTLVPNPTISGIHNDAENIKITVGELHIEFAGK